METLKYIIINLALFSSWFLFLANKKKDLSFADRIIGSFILGLAQIIATEMLLGILFKQLYATPLFILNIIISSSVFIAASARRNIFSNAYNEIKAETERILNIINYDRSLLFIFALFLASVCWMIFLGYLFPSYAWDALWYHLPMVGYIMQSGAIHETYTPWFIDQFINIFPKNTELFFLWNTIFLKSDNIVDLSQMFFTVMGVLTIYSVALKLKVGEKYAIYSSLLFFFTPIMILQSTTNYVDVAISVLFLIAVNFLISRPEDHADDENVEVYFKKWPLLLSGIAAGILLGSKGSGPLFIAILSLAILSRMFFKRLNPFNRPSHSKKIGFLRHGIRPYLLNFLLPAILFGSYWYIKNWVLYGNPVYPMEIAIADITIFKGLYGGIIDPSPEVLNNLSPLKKLLYVWEERVKYYLYDSRFSGFGPLWFILFLPGILFSTLLTIKRKEHNFLFIGIILIVTFILYPRNWNTRYVIFIVGLGAISFGMILEYFKERENILKILALLLAGYTSLVSNSPCVMPEKIKEFISLPAEDRTIAHLAPFNIDMHARQEYGYWIWISKNISAGETLAYTFEPLFHSPLWNRGFSSKIVSIKSDTHPEWLKTLKEKNVTYILVRTRSIEDGWIEKEAEALKSLWWVKGSINRYETVYSDINYKIVRFKKAGE
ncbi:MAG: hypothetical protein HZC48_03550 [Nitrospirae bacterium]|nr:hypothetical protein [Nitrospirota bacterium]